VPCATTPSAPALPMAGMQPRYCRQWDDCCTVEDVYKSINMFHIVVNFNKCAI
jgi:hypothetical protein